MATVTSHGIEIHYEVTGSGPPVLLQHSFLCSGEMWAHQVGALAGRYQMINIDLRGHGRSGPIEAPFTLYDMVDDAVAVLDDLGVDRAVWAGLSIGGMVSLRGALAVPERVAGLGLLDTDAGPERGLRIVKYRLLGALAKYFGLRPVMGQVVQQMFGRTTRTHQPELVAHWRERFRHVHIPSTLHMLTSLIQRDDLTERLGTIEALALVLVGSEDASLPPARSRALAAGLPAAELVEIPGAGHLSAVEEPEAVTRALGAFLDRICGAGRPKMRPSGAAWDGNRGGEGR